MIQWRRTTQVCLAFDKEKLYKNMVDAKADWLYELPQWETIFDEETRRRLYLEQKKSGTVVVGKKIGRKIYLSMRKRQEVQAVLPVKGEVGMKITLKDGSVKEMTEQKAYMRSQRILARVLQEQRVPERWTVRLSICARSYRLTVN